jgi:serine/threonine protein phosphatase PrpC
MGGAAAGEIASSIFVETARDIFLNVSGRSREEVTRCVQNVFVESNKKILEHVKTYPDHKGMGCTAELIALSDEGVVMGHIGDSRIYRYQDGNLEQMTHDHSLVQDQLDQGLITPAEARKHPHRNVINRAVGVRNGHAVDLLNETVLLGDLFLLCSDGLTDLVEDAEIRAVLASPDSLHQKAEKLIELAKAGSGKDNITTVLCEIV